jgi:hypothetical protein
MIGILSSSKILKKKEVLMARQQSNPTNQNPNETFNSNFTAIPKDATSEDVASVDPDVVANNIDFGEMNLEDAKASGYTDENGNAVDMAKKTHKKEEDSTGAFTDVGEGRSSVVKRDHHH